MANPCVNGFTVYFSEEEAQLSIYNSTGAFVLSKIVRGETYVPIHSEMEGLHFVEIEGNVLKFIILNP